MRHFTLAGIALALVSFFAISNVAVVARIEEPTTKPAHDSSDAKEDGANIKLFAPYSKMTSLSADQKSQIRAIHKRTLAEIRALEDKQDADISALLNDAQRKELRELEDQDTAKRKSKDGKGK